ncbi:DUF262 domain-containing protein [Pedobacter immunditicola]|uniref:DUF262 domain-containing protein n=1 Tax=Pedobacter immunditicola TaxID=3133440 RepID=UPI0030B536F8
MTQQISELTLEAVSHKYGNSIALKSISELMGKQFYIPSYQRGYRWTKQQVEDLLTDIYVFATDKEKDKKEFYCLQPVIVKYNSEKAHYEVIDGQQRLTTIRIILSYIIKEDYQGKSIAKEYGEELFDIDYQTRPNTKLFLANIKEDNDENIDFLHISNAFKVIREWFDNQNKPGKSRRIILDALLLDYLEEGSSGAARVIWYEIKDEQTNPIDTFIRINLGKISLTNSELIRALFLQERNLGEGDSAKLKQLEIAQQWDEIENRLQDEQFWWFLNKSGNQASSHIEFIFDMMKDVALAENPNLLKSIGDDSFTTFRYFNTLFSQRNNLDAIKTNWAKIKEYFEFFVECFENPVWYHYMGFLIYCGTPIKTIYDLMNDKQNITKVDATKKLISRIRNHEFKNLQWKNISDDPDKTEYTLRVDFNNDKLLLRKIFLLFNLEYIINKSSQENLVYKFPFKSFKIDKKEKEQASWDIEHIDSYTENPMDKDADRKAWLENAKQDLHFLPSEADLLQEINAFIRSPNGKHFPGIYDKIRAKTGEDSIPDELKNSLGNLTLLDAGTNRGYGNALFSTKRRKIIKKDKEGVFVPICTKNVFFKYFDGNSRSNWTIEDIDAYRKTIEETLKDLLPPKPASNEQV